MLPATQLQRNVLAWNVRIPRSTIKATVKEGWITLDGQVDVKEKIEEAFKRSAEIDAAHVKVDVDGAKVTLSGTVPSWIEYEDAANAAWSAAGVGSVENRLVVENEAAVF